MGLAYGATEAGLSGNASRISYLIKPGGEIAHAFGDVNVGTHAADVLAQIG